MPASIFISHVYEDLNARNTIRKWAEQGLLGNVAITGESEDVRQGGQNAIRKHLSSYLEGAAAVLVLVGNDTHNHEWIRYEVDHARSHHKNVVPVRITGTTGGLPPALSGLNLIAMDPTAIKRALGT